MSNVYFCSDLHLSHPRILLYEPARVEATAKFMLKDTYFESGDAYKLAVAEIIDKFNKAVEENNTDYWNYILQNHDEMLIYNWNSVVKENDEVWFLGDFAFRDKTKAEEYGRRLNGHKYIILGNHDDRKKLASGITKYNDTLVAHFKACGFERVEFDPVVLCGSFILSHEPVNYINVHFPLYSIYGHIHSNPEFQTETDYSMCACVERHDFKPFRCHVFDEFLKHNNN